jgi:predicted ribosomally synthesized peptide with SipW-like signal peptide
MEDDNSKIGMSRRKVLAGLGTIGVASAGAGAGTMALFSDEERSTGNVVRAGTLDLKVHGNDIDGQSVPIQTLAPGERSDPYTVPLKNAGTVDGYLNFVLVGTNDEGTNPDAETDTSGNGDLGDVLEVTFEHGDDVLTGTFNEVFNRIYDVDIPLAAGATERIAIECKLPDSAGNDVQGDTVTADLYAYLHQQRGQFVGRTFDLQEAPSNEGPYGGGSALVANNLVGFDTSDLVQPASEWGAGDNVGFWFGDGSDTVELKYSDGSWGLPNNSIGADLSEFEYSLSDDQFTVAFPSDYTEFGLYVEQIVPPSGGGGDRRVAVVTEGGDVPWRDDLVSL